MALAETVCMSLTEYQQFAGFTIGLSMITGFVIGAWASARRYKKRYSSREFMREKPESL